MESTAKGIGNFFYDEFWRAWRGESGFRSAFFPWFIFPEYKVAPLSEHDLKSDKFMNSLGTEKRYGGRSELELLGYKKIYNIGDDVFTFEITPEHLKWRRKTIDTQCQGDLLLFNQEYPVTEESAFISSGRSVFDLNVLNRMQLRVNENYEFKPPELYRVPVNEFSHRRVEGYADRTMKYYLDPDDLGELEIWTHPVVDREYRIGCDVSEGIEVSNRDTDFSVICVIDAETLEQCAMWRGKIDPDLWAGCVAPLVGITTKRC